MFRSTRQGARRLFSRRRLLTGTGLLRVAAPVLALGWLFPLPAAAVDEQWVPSPIEGEFIGLVNQERRDAGLAPLAPYFDLTDDARRHAERMAASGSIYHSSRQTLTSYTTGWSRLGENVGMGHSPEALMAAFMESSQHRANILGDYGFVGVGSTVDPSGKIFVTLLFAEFPAGWRPGSPSVPDQSRFVGGFQPTGAFSTLDYYWSNGRWLRRDGTVFADYSTTKGWEHRSGDFNGDGKDDIASFHPSNGTWWVSLAGSAGARLWADFSTPSGWQHYVGDVTGDGRDDIISYHPSNGTWWVSSSTGSRFVTTRWASFSTKTGWLVQVADTNRDGRDDVSSWHPSNDSWWQLTSTGRGFMLSRIR